MNRILDGSETKDSAVAAFADANGMVLISKDSDFRDSHFVTGTPASLLRVTLGNRSNIPSARGFFAALHAPRAPGRRCASSR